MHPFLLGAPTTIDIYCYRTSGAMNPATGLLWLGNIACIRRADSQSVPIGIYGNKGITELKIDWFECKLYA